jgi:hypothetical protein
MLAPDESGMFELQRKNIQRNSGVKITLFSQILQKKFVEILSMT